MAGNDCGFNVGLRRAVSQIFNPRFSLNHNCANGAYCNRVFGLAFIFLIFINLYYATINQAQTASGKDWLFVFIIAALAGFISLLIYYRGLQSTKASVATIAELAFPFSAVIINWIFLGATLSFVQILAGIVLLFSISRLSSVNSD